MLNFQTDYDEATGEQVLTCFLLPQMEYQQIENAGKLYFFKGIFAFWYFDFHILQILFTWVEWLVLSVSSFSRTESSEKMIWVTVLHF